MEDIYRRILEFSNDGVCHYTFEEGKILFANKGLVNLLGLDAKPHDLKGKLLKDVLTFSGMEDAIQNILREKGKTHGFEYHFKTLKGHDRWVLYDSFITKDFVTGQRIVEVILKDITQRKQEEIITGKLASIVEFSDDAIISLTLEGIIDSWNAGAEKIFGFGAKETIGCPFTILIAGDNFTEASNIIEKIKRGESIIHHETEWLKKGGEKICVSLTISAIRDEIKQPTAVSIIARDITERKIAEQEKKAREVAEAANQAKSEFFSNMSHEIRTPLNAIIGIADLLYETPLNEEQKKYVETYRYSGETLLNIIDNILDLSKIEAGQITLEEIDFNLTEVVEKVCDIMALRAQEKKVELAFQIMPDVETNLKGDSHKLREVILNLLGNAVKFTERGHIFLKVENDPHDKTPGSLFFSVSDTGVGIPQHKLDAIFERFTQADSSTTRKYGGTGLGLTISKKIVELMGGKIWAQSPSAIKLEWPTDIGEGSTFCFLAKFKVQPEIEKIKKGKVDLKGLKVLVVDDLATNRMIVNDMLSHWGANVVQADCGAAAVDELVKSSNAKQPYDIILLDKNMPQMDGFGVAEFIVSNPDIAAKTLIMLTSDSSAADIKRAHDLGIEGYLVKPIKQSDLKNTIISAVTKEKIKEEIQKKTAASAEIKMKPADILLAEDSEDNIFLIESYLKNTPYKVEVAFDGTQAVEKFTQGRYDLILMDVQMPILDGNSAAYQIRKIEEEKGLKKTPIIALTAYVLPEEIQKSIEAGCSNHISKPVKKQTLLDMLKKYL